MELCVLIHNDGTNVNPCFGLHGVQLKGSSRAVENVASPSS